MQHVYTDPAPDRAYLFIMRMYTAVVFAVVFPLFLFMTLASAIIVSLNRGAQFVRWRSPRDCMSFIHWAAFEWNYNGLGGHQSGVRALGLEVAYSGVLR